MKNELTTGFDYESVDKDTAGKLAYYAERGHKLIRKSQIGFIAEMGELLSEAQKALASHNKNEGTFIKWACAEFDLGKQTVYNYVNAWNRMLSNGWTTYQNLSPTAIYLLTAEETSKPVLKKVEHLATQQPVRKADVQRLIDASKPKPKPPATPKTQEQETPDVVSQPQDTNTVVAHVELETSDKPAASIVLDAMHREIPAKFRAANELSVTLLSIGREVDKFRQKARELSEQPGGEWLRLQEIDEHVRALKGHLQEAGYYTVCHQCKSKGCQRCEQNGWLPKFKKGTVV